MEVAHSVPAESRHEFTVARNCEVVNRDNYDEELRGGAKGS